MKLYVANLTLQHQILLYRVPGHVGVHQQRIPIGGQVSVFGDLSSEQIEGIIAQHAKYGLVKFDEIDRFKGHAVYCWRVGSPVNVERVKRMMAHNHSVLHQRGELIRKQAAVTANHVIENPAEEVHIALKNMEVEIVEVDKGAGVNVDDHMKVTSRAGGGDDGEPSKTRRRRSKNEGLAA